jgi:D-alanyl-D-alanine carboxypeptidase/D-alanyl-D-alanine-endopeptidase (penicillin-binding protein 4)
MRVLLIAFVAAIVTACAAPAPVSAPVLSSARSHVPRLATWSAADVRALRAMLRAVFADPRLAAAGIAIVDASAQPLYVQHERAAYTPASTFKLLAGITALATFGRTYRFPTELRAFDMPRDGTIAGDLWLVGSGDPTLTAGDLRRGAHALARHGVRAIDGALVADDSAFAGPEINAAWDPDDLMYDYAAGSSALALDGGTVEFHLVPARVGAAAHIDVRPPGDAVRVRGEIMTSSATMLDIERAATSNDFAFTGRIAANAEQSFWRPLVGLGRYAGALERDRLRDEGIAVRSGVRTGVAPLGGAVLWHHVSAPLSEVVREMWFVSDNHVAEQLLRSLGARYHVGTVASGASVERRLLAQAHVPAPGLRIVDASGLAATNRIAPLTLAALLAHAARWPAGSDVIHDLPRVGVEGTVRYRPLTTARGRVRAKSGHIGGVNALAGYVNTSHHGRIAFAIIVNGAYADDGPVDDGIDRALDVLATR